MWPVWSLFKIFSHPWPREQAITDALSYIFEMLQETELVYSVCVCVFNDYSNTSLKSFIKGWYLI